MRLAFVSTAALLLALAALALVPAPAAADHHCVFHIDADANLVCQGDRWCDNGGLCGQEYCLTETMQGQWVCVLSGPGRPVSVQG